VNAVPSQSKTKDKMRGADKASTGSYIFTKNMANGKREWKRKGKWEYGEAIVQIKGGGVSEKSNRDSQRDVEEKKAEAGYSSLWKSRQSR